MHCGIRKIVLGSTLGELRMVILYLGHTHSESVGVNGREGGSNEANQAQERFRFL